VIDQVRLLVDGYWEFLLAHDPILRARQGLPIELLPQVSLDESERRALFAQAILDDCAWISAEGDDEDTLAFIAQLAQDEVLWARQYWLTPTATPYSLLNLSLYGSTVFRPFRFDSGADAERYLSLMGDLVKVLRSVSDKLRGQAEQGIRIPRLALTGAGETIIGLRASLSRGLQVSDDRLVALGPAARSRFREAVARSVDVDLESAFDELIGVLDDPGYQAGAPDEVGWAHYPGGEEAYRAFVRQQVTVDVMPEDLHELGLQQCAELAERMREVRAALGFTGSEAEFHDRLASEPRLFARTPAEVEACYLTYVARLEPLLPNWFSALPRAPYGVARVDPELDASLTYGFYELPRAGQPVGRYRYNGSGLDHRSLLGAATLIYHELAPGHHFQIARQAENDTLPSLRREVAEFTAFVEGWAEYAAGLGWEMGLYEDPWDAYGRLAHERFMAQRLVVDTGLNLATMTLGQAHAFMRANTIESDAQIGPELLRYATDLPGQALTYRTGYLEFIAQRAAARSRAGAAFDVRDFHEAILSGGTLPFPALRRRLERELPAQTVCELGSDLSNGSGRA
jgi:uncharacterized protein (DUF885 family)